MPNMGRRMGRGLTPIKNICHYQDVFSFRHQYFWTSLLSCIFIHTCIKNKIYIRCSKRRKVIFHKCVTLIMLLWYWNMFINVIYTRTNKTYVLNNYWIVLVVLLQCLEEKTLTMFLLVTQLRKALSDYFF